MSATVGVLTAQEVDPTGQYKCPLCTVQTTADEEDIGWIRCPMINDQVICMGCCFDFQIMTRSENFDAHPFREDLDQLAHKTGDNVLTLRRVCLQHQEDMITDALGRGGTPRFERDMHINLSIVRARMKSLDESEMDDS